MRFENKITAELLRVVKACVELTVVTTSKAVDKPQKLAHVSIESGEKITFIAQQSMVGTQLKSILLKS